MTNKIKIVIADDHNLVRQSIAKALDLEPNFKVIGQAENGKALIDMAKHAKPDIVILDLEMPVMDGHQVLDFFNVAYPDCKVIILSMHFENILIKDLIKKGARGFLPKNSDFETLINANYEVNDLGYFFGKKISSTLVKELMMDRTIEPMVKQLKLTDKEADALMLICQDKLTKEIAASMQVSERTIERYKTCLYEKTKAKTSAGLVLFALRNNIIRI